MGWSSATPRGPEGHTPVQVASPGDGFGSVAVSTLVPRIQIDAVYGILSTDHETFTDGSSGAVSASGALFQCTTGTSVGGYGVIRSRRLVRNRPGQSTTARFSTMFTTPGVALSLQLGGMFNSEDALFVGYNGTTFGFLRRIAGAAHVPRLTVTTGASGAETMTVTLNGAAFTIASGGALSTTATAEAIAERVGGYTGWTSGVSPTANGSTVTWVQGTPGAVSGAFTLTSTGTAAGTFATIQAGAANDSDTGFVAKSAWNVDRLDGSGGEYNPSGITLDPAKLNEWQIIYSSGAHQIVLQYADPNDGWITVHRIVGGNAATTPTQSNPTYRMGWVAASLGSTTALTVRGAYAAALLSGENYSARDPYTARNSAYSATTTEYVALAIRNRGEFAGRLNHRELLPHTVRLAVESASRIAVARVVLNPTMTGAVTWGYVDSALSAAEVATPTNVAATGGREVASIVATTSDLLSLEGLDLRLEPGDVLAICIATVSASSTTSTAIGWAER